MLSLPDVTLFTCTNVNIEKTIVAMEHSLNLVEFGAAKFITNGVDFRHDRFETIQEPRLIDYRTYSEVCIFELHKFVDTKYCLVIQADGFVINPEMWSDEFLQYDYIGAVGYLAGIDPPIVGNGGFSFRSKKILDFPYDISGSETEFRKNFKVPYYFFEDYFICVDMRETLENRGVKFAPKHGASQFSVEPYDIRSPKQSFGFHYGHYF